MRKRARVDLPRLACPKRRTVAPGGGGRGGEGEGGGRGRRGREEGEGRGGGGGRGRGRREGDNRILEDNHSTSAVIDSLGLTSSLE